MAVDLASEHIVTADQASKLIGPARKEKSPHRSRIIRAIKSGALEGLRFGNQWVTSIEALQRWGERQAGMAQGAPPTAAPVADRARTPAQRQRDVKAAKRDLAGMGL